MLHSIPTASGVVALSGLLFAALVGPGETHAMEVRTRISTDASNGFTSVGVPFRTQQSPAGPLSDSSVASIDSVSFTEAWVHADYGWVRARSEVYVEGDAPERNRSASATAQGGFTDDITIHLPGQEGELARATFFVDVAGTIAVVPISFPQSSVPRSVGFWELSLVGERMSGGIDGILDVSGSRNMSFIGNSQVRGDPSGGSYMSDPFGIFYGEPFTLTLDFLVEASAITVANPFGLPSPDVGAQALFGDTLAWMGLEVRDDDGNLIEGYTVTSASGTDYSGPIAPIPEPTTALLLALGLAVLAVTRDRVDEIVPTGSARMRRPSSTWAGPRTTTRRSPVG